MIEQREDVGIAGGNNGDGKQDTGESFTGDEAGGKQQAAAIGRFGFQGLESPILLETGDGQAQEAPDKDGDFELEGEIDADGNGEYRRAERCAAFGEILIEYNHAHGKECADANDVPW